MYHQPHVGFIDAHPERYRRTYHSGLVRHPSVLHGSAVLGSHCRVIRLRAKSGAFQSVSDRLGFASRKTIYDRRAGSRLHEVHHGQCVTRSLFVNADF
uniref:Uncharacterized protein n=1 Tax=Diadromus pulchellus ascovirus 4a TaxID=158683 RepID=Q9DSV2_9VIRU|nr:hypothetical protein [Diadromus pulchellus ascovirus 4a]